uniref:Uncharacterized protein n=1 Tax=Timema cristinae TaxID=61476 RepID=A0A7R9HD93_TIMCR|nr:unnamed protein product [Timema cristinae]
MTSSIASKWARNVSPSVKNWPRS